MTDISSIKIPPYHYIHVLDRNANVTRLEQGPQTFIRQDHEKIVTGATPVKMVVLPPRHYCEISDPIALGKDGKPLYDKYNQVCVRHGEVEIRFSEKYNEPFPLYPGEGLKLKPNPLLVVKENTALKIEAIRNFEIEETVGDKVNKKKILAGDEWLFYGPNTYYPRVEARIVTVVNASVIEEQQALKLRARQDFTDRTKVLRKTGEEWLIRTPGTYLPEINEIVLGIVNGYTLTSQFAIKLSASKNFKDIYGIERKAGEEWIITHERASCHIIDIFEEFLEEVSLTILRKNQYCYINDPLDPQTKRNRLGTKILRVGETNFFLQPGESLDGGIKNAAVLREDQALLLKCNETFKDEEGEERKPGDRWMVHGPSVYVPPVQVEILEYRSKIPLDTNEGVYVRDIRTGLVRCEFGQSYMLKAHEEFWLKELSDLEEGLLAKNYAAAGLIRDKRKVVTFRCPFDNVVQIYDYKQKKSRCILGPALIYLGPDEQFTVAVLSGETPKKPGVIKKISVHVSPTFTTDIVQVETSDHTRLKLELSYNWCFKYDANDQQSLSMIFEVKDFIGNLCNQLGSKVRSAVAAVGFDEFHKNSARIIRKSVFGIDDKGKIKPELILEANSTCVTNVDIKSVEPIDKITNDNLQKAVTQAIEISTKSLEAQYKYQSDMMEQQAQGQLEKIKIGFQSKAEEAKKKLTTVQSETQSIQNTGKATAEAKARAEAAKIESETKVKIAELKAAARKVQLEAELNKKTSMQKVEIEHEQAISSLEIEKAGELAKIESEKFQAIIGAIGQDTLVSIANAGPEFQAELLQGLGLSGYIMTDGNNPINLFNTATGLIGGGSLQESFGQ